MKHGSDEALRAGKHTFSCDSTQQGRRARMQFTLFARAASHAWLDGAGAFFALIDSVEFCCAMIISIAVSPLAAGPP